MCMTRVAVALNPRNPSFLDMPCYDVGYGSVNTIINHSLAPPLSCLKPSRWSKPKKVILYCSLIRVVFVLNKLRSVVSIGQDMYMYVPEPELPLMRNHSAFLSLEQTPCCSSGYRAQHAVILSCR
jgi:hypothetical protein